MNHKSFFQTAKEVLEGITEMKSEIRRSTSFSASIENLEDRQMMTATGFGDPMETPPSPIVEVAPVLQVSPVTIRGVNIRINGQDGFVSANDPQIKLNAGDELEVVSVDLHVTDSLENRSGVFALEGYMNKINSDAGPSSSDYRDGRFSTRDSALPVALGALSMGGLDGGWNVENGWDRLTLNLQHYFGNESSSEATFSIKMQVGTPEFEFGDDIDDFAEKPITVGEEVNIVGSWFNTGQGQYHNYAEVDIFFECEDTPAWVGVLVGNADSGNGVSGEFLFPTENGDQFSERWSPEKAGTYRIEFSVDPEKLWDESNELDNRLLLEITVTEPSNTVDVGNTGGGVVSQDSATGEGFIMYSQQDINERFGDQPVFKGNADHFVTVRFHEGNWQYDTNDEYVNFKPEATDVLVASVDFTADKIKSLEGDNMQFNGMQLGFEDSDLKFKANVWNGEKNYGDFGLTGSTITFHRSSENPIEFNRQTIAASEFSEVGNVIGQLKAVGGESETEFEVIGGSGEGKFKVDDSGRVYLAEKIDFESQNSFRILIEAKSGDQVSVAELVINVLDEVEETSVQIGDFGEGVTFNDRNIGEAYIMYSAEDVHDRFTKKPIDKSDADHFVTVMNHDGYWHYETKGRIIRFTPNETDVLIAKIDFPTESVEMLLGENSEVKGVAAGYSSGDLNVESNGWNGWTKQSSFRLSGSTLNLN